MTSPSLAGADKPRFYHFDIARGAYLRPETFKQALQGAAAAGFTHFVPYLENMIRLPATAKACPACAYTPELWAEFQTAAMAAGIALVPHANVIGHSHDICLAYPELADNHPGEGSLDPTVDATRDWTRRVLSEFAACSPPGCFLIGGDEWQPPRHLLVKPGFDTGRAWVEQMNLASETLVPLGFTPLVWHDMLIHFPAVIDTLSRDAVILFWYYDEDSDYAALDLFRRHGFRVVMAAGVCGPYLCRRWANGVACARRAQRHHETDGFMLTTWENVTWEHQRLTMACVGRFLRTGTWPATLVDAASRLDVLERLPAESALAADLRQEAEKLLASPDWAEFPECRDDFLARLAPDLEARRRSFERYHYADGPIYQHLLPGAPAPAQAARVAPAPKLAHASRQATPAFGLRVHEDTELGTVIRFHNAGETFVVYPRFAGTLQDWRQGEQVLIPHTVPDWVARVQPQSGGYRGYTGAGGLRPIWALGTHLNPNILWQSPAAWRIVEQSESRLELEVSQAFAHADITRRISVTRGEDGFRYRVTAVNRLPGAAGGWNFNFLLHMPAEEFEHLRFTWEEDGRQSTDIRRALNTVLKVDARRHLAIVTRHWTVTVDSDPDHTAFYLVDWSSAGRYITPDVHSIFRDLEVGQTLTTEWRFRAECR